MEKIIAAFIFGWFAAPALNAFFAALQAVAVNAYKSHKSAKRQGGVE